jgi:hypothetical protein
MAAGTPPTVKAGEPTKFNSAGAVILFADGEGTTTERFTGIAAKDSAETAGASGYVETYLPLMGIIYEAAPKSAAAADTQGEIDALLGKRVVWDLTASVFTIDTAAADNAANCVMIIDHGDPTATKSIWFHYNIDGSVLFSG